jgi:hypothetical protein
MHSRNSVIAVCTPWIVVSRSLLMLVIATFTFEPGGMTVMGPSSMAATVLFCAWLLGGGEDAVGFDSPDHAVS